MSIDHVRMSVFRLFPWVSGILDVKPFHLYRIIEVVVKQEEALTRDVIKHLNWVSTKLTPCH